MLSAGNPDRALGQWGESLKALKSYSLDKASAQVCAKLTTKSAIRRITASATAMSLAADAC